jgi:hypothetical protein
LFSLAGKALDVSTKFEEVDFEKTHKAVILRGAQAQQPNFKIFERETGLLLFCKKKTFRACG